MPEIQPSIILIFFIFLLTFYLQAFCFILAEVRARVLYDLPGKKIIRKRIEKSSVYLLPDVFMPLLTMIQLFEIILRRLVVF